MNENTKKSADRAAVVIPARYASTRLPRKMLLNESGKPLIQYAYEAAFKAELPELLCVACDHPEIFSAVEGFGGKAVMTDPEAKSGTDRIAEVARSLDDFDIIVNLQGDEPEMKPGPIDQVIRILIDRPDAVMATLCTPIREKWQLDDPACVKVVFNREGNALYFSRSVIPYPRNWTDEMLNEDPPLYYLHLGLYAYRKDFLLKLTGLPQSAAERTESLEQLRVLDHGYPIAIAVTDHSSSGIDTPEDYERFLIREKGDKEKVKGKR